MEFFFEVDLEVDVMLLLVVISRIVCFSLVLYATLKSSGVDLGVALEVEVLEMHAFPLVL